MKKLLLCSALTFGMLFEVSAWNVVLDDSDDPLNAGLSKIAVQERMDKLAEYSEDEAKRMFRKLYNNWLKDTTKWSNEGKNSTLSNILGSCNGSLIKGIGEGDWTSNFTLMLSKIEARISKLAAETEEGATAAANAIISANAVTDAQNEATWGYTFETDDGYIELDREGNPILTEDAKRRIESELLAQKQANLQEQEQNLEVAKQTNEANLRQLRILDSDGNIKKNGKGKEYINEGAVQWIDRKITEATHEVAVDAEEQTARHELELSKAQVLTNLKAAIGQMETSLYVDNPSINDLTEFDLALLSKIMKEVGVDLDENFIVGMKRVWGLTPLDMSVDRVNERASTRNVGTDEYGNKLVQKTYQLVDPNALTNADVALLLLDHFSDTDTVKEEGDWSLHYDENGNLTNMKALLKKGRDLIKTAGLKESANFILNSLYGIEVDDYKNAVSNVESLLKKYGLDISGVDGESVQEKIKEEYIGVGKKYAYDEVAEAILKTYGIKRQWKDDITQKIIDTYVPESNPPDPEIKILETTVINLLNWTSIEKSQGLLDLKEIIREENEDLSVAILRVFGDQDNREEVVETILSKIEVFKNAFGEHFDWKREEGNTLESDIVDTYCSKVTGEDRIKIAEEIISQVTGTRIRGAQDEEKLEDELQFLREKIPDPENPEGDPIPDPADKLEDALARVLGTLTNDDKLSTKIIRSYSSNNHEAETAEIILNNLDPLFKREDGETVESAIIRLYNSNEISGGVAWEIAKENLEINNSKTLGDEDILSYEIVKAYKAVKIEEVEVNQRKTAEAILSSVPVPTRDGSVGSVCIPIERESTAAEELPALSLEYEIINTYGDPYESGETLKSILNDNFGITIDEEDLSQAVQRKYNKDDDAKEILAGELKNDRINQNVGESLEQAVVEAFSEKAVGYVIKDKTGITVDDAATDFDDAIQEAFVKNALMERYCISEDGDLCRSFNKMKFHVNLVARILQQISNERDVTKLTPTGIKTRAVWFHSFRQYMLQTFRDAVPLVRLAYTVNHDKWWNSLLP